jgi:hypothetical protein
MDGGWVSGPHDMMVVIVDRGSDGAALERCRASVSRIGPIHVSNGSVDETSALIDKSTPSTWVLMLEAHEWLADDAASLIIPVIKHDQPNIRAYSFPRFNYWNNRILKGPNFYPDRHIRLMRAADAILPNRVFKASEVICLKNPHLHHALGSTILDAVTMIQQADFAAGDQPDSSFRDSLYRMHAIIAQSGSDVDGDEGLALSYLKAWQSLVNGLRQWEGRGSRESLRDTFALPISTVQREQNEGLKHLLSEREDHLRLIRDLQFELAKRPARLKDVAALIKQTVSRIFTRKS